MSKNLNSDEIFSIINTGQCVEVYTKSDHMFIVLPISTTRRGEKMYLCSLRKEACDIHYRYIDNYFLFKSEAQIQDEANRASSIIIYSDYEKISPTIKKSGLSWHKTFKPARIRPKHDENGDIKS